MTDSRGRGIAVGKLIRCERPGLPSWRGFVRFVDADLVQCEDRNGKLRSAHPGECVVIRSTPAQRERRTHVLKEQTRTKLWALKARTLEVRKAKGS